jgi:hypothetical protein
LVAQAQDGWIAVSEPEAMPSAHRPTVAAPRVPQHRSRLSPDRWPVVAADARTLGLRQAARQHGVSHQTVANIVERVDAAERSSLASAAD